MSDNFIIFLLQVDFPNYFLSATILIHSHIPYLLCIRECQSIFKCNYSNSFFTSPSLFASRDVNYFMCPFAMSIAMTDL
jgi:hypothetical protein